MSIDTKTEEPLREEDFWDWLPKAYRDGAVGDAPKFTKWNMEAAYKAGIASVKKPPARRRPLRPLR